jgi:hypothetical protein
MERQINKMLAEYPENDPLFLGADRLGPLGPASPTKSTPLAGCSPR